MNAAQLDILHLLYVRTAGGAFLTLYEMEVQTGKRGLDLRGIIEDLMEAEYVVEAPEGFRVSKNGINFGMVRWV